MTKPFNKFSICFSSDIYPKSRSISFYTNLDGQRSIKRYTVNRSPFVSKKSRDQLEYRTNRLKICTKTVEKVNINQITKFVDSANGAQVSILRHEVHDHVTITY